MDLRPVTLVTSLAIMAGIIAPVALTAYLTKQDVIETEKGRALAYASDVVARSEAVTDQVDNAIKRLVAARGADPCSAAGQALMRQIDLSSSYIQAIGHVVNNRIICSSLGKDVDGFELGPVDMERQRGVKIRLNVEFPFAKGARFLVVERDGYVAIIHKDLPIDTTTNVKDVALATVVYPEARVLTSRGVIEPRWIKAVPAQTGAQVDENFIVAIAASKHYSIGAISAVPVTEMNKRIYSVSLMTIPAGLLASLLLTWALFRLSRLQTAMPAMIRRALKRKEFYLEYQPLVELATGKWVGAEALIRWRLPDGEIVRPDIFIPVAEENGLIQQVSRYVVGHIAAEAGAMFRRYPDFHIGINLSAADLHDEATILLLRNLAADAGARHSSILVEATERSLTNHDLASTVISRLRAEGFPVAIDDFGTGYSSLSYLQQIKFDYLKIDKSFVGKLNTDAATANLILHIIEMAKSLRMKIIAEGVETEMQAQYLREHGVQFAQGWLYGKPMSFEALLLALEGWAPRKTSQQATLV